MHHEQRGSSNWAIILGLLLIRNEAGTAARRLRAPRHLPYAAASTEAYFRAAAAILSVPPDKSETDMSATLLKRHYGLEGSITILSSEVERTAEVSLSDGRQLILKTSARRGGDRQLPFPKRRLGGATRKRGICCTYSYPHQWRRVDV